MSEKLRKAIDEASGKKPKKEEGEQSPLRKALDEAKAGKEEDK